MTKLKVFGNAKKYILNILKYLKILRTISTARKESNIWLRSQALSINGKVLSLGSGNDDDGEGNKYKNYFENCLSYTTSEITSEFNCDLVLDVRAMPDIKDDFFDCIFCSGVLEHIDDYQKALQEIYRILRTGGILLLGLPFRQAIHLPPNDYWRFSEFGIQYILNGKYKILDLVGVDNTIIDFPVAYWVKAEKL